jgi:hypothetical protein
VLLLSSGARSRVRGVAPGASTATLRRRIGRVKGYKVGTNRWYLRKGGGARQVFRVSRGRVREVGLADARLTRTRRGALRFLRSFR